MDSCIPKEEEYTPTTHTNVEFWTIHRSDLCSFRIATKDEELDLLSLLDTQISLVSLQTAFCLETRQFGTRLKRQFGTKTFRHRIFFQTFNITLSIKIHNYFEKYIVHLKGSLCTKTIASCS